MNRGFHYHTEREAVTAETSHGRVLALLGAVGSVLDVGCSTGVLARTLREQGREVLGIEADPAAAAVAAAAGVEVVVADVEQRDLGDVVGGRTFDWVVFADLLEHTRDPAAVLIAARAVLRPGGAVIVSVPNVTHASVRLSLMLGRFAYQEKGLLDRTHLRFFTVDVLAEVAAAAGYALDAIERVRADAFAVPEEMAIPLDRSEIPESWLGGMTDVDADTFQIVARLVPAEPDDDAPAALAREVAAARVEHGRLVRLLDRERESARRLRRRVDGSQERYLEALALRDALIGAQAELGQLRFDHEQFRLEVVEMERWYQKELAHVHGSRAWRIGRLCTWPVRALRRAVRGDW